MTTPDHIIKDLLDQKLPSQGFGLINLVEVPRKTDHHVRLKTIQQILEEFESDDSTESRSYLVHIKVNSSPPHLTGATTHSALAIPSVHDQVYLPNGKLNSEFLFQNADLLIAAGDYPLAKNIYRSVLQHGTDTAKALTGLARCFECEGNFDRAQSHYEESIAYHATLDGYQKLIALLLKNKKDQYAAESMERALNLEEIGDTTRFDLHKACGNTWVRASNCEKAEQHYRSALEIRPTADEILSNLGTLYLRSNKMSEARTAFQEAIISNEKNDKAYIGLGCVLFMLNDKRQAHDYFLKAMDLDLKNPTAIYYLVKCAYELRLHGPAEVRLAKYIEVAPVNTNLLYSLAGLQFHLGKMGEARQTAERLLQVRPDHTGTLELLKLIRKYS